MMSRLLIRGMIAGLLAGLATLLFALVFGEPGVNGGIAFEEQAAAASGDAPEMELVSRGVQSTAGLATAVVVYGVAIGGIFALVYTLAQGRLGRLTPRAMAAVLALIGFLVVFVVPFVKYPANPPGSNDGDTISQRTGLYLVLVLASVLVALAGIALRQQLTSRLGTWNATLVGVAVYVAVIGVIEYLMPAIIETPDTFPAPLLYGFRLASLGGQLMLWTTLGLTFGALVDRTRACDQWVDARLPAIS
ncbi:MULTISPECIES: CbtA family protein [unclassified Pseudonocardia]|uniref:CbtA family protein n=1 Tax=unclassified Pseudonocardia TaxID=2619320 RepID=UPI00095B376B|nr:MULTISPECIES: CbtA family protein [unclassified Pseudonocardia]MBN9098014.1 CbtA family protein [Pseudonocardia sp.]OJY54416.1 MAG: hypothetical protein BGP03_23040 [Pseudonocardia sp. 73-21]